MTAVDSAPGFDHEALFYRRADDFLAGVVPFLREGLARGEAVVVAEPRDRLDLLRDALGQDAAGVDFVDMAEIGANPSRIIPVWAAAVDEHVVSGRGLRGVGEPAWHPRGRRRTRELVARFAAYAVVPVSTSTCTRAPSSRPSTCGPRSTPAP